MSDVIELEPLAKLVLWVGFFCMFGSFCYFYVSFRLTPGGKRLFHAYTTAIVGFAATAYLYMALGYGATMVGDRIFHYARYLDWLVTTPLLLLDLAGLAGVSLEDSIMLVVLDVLMVLSGLAGGLTGGFAGFCLWLIGCIFFLPIVYDLIFTFREKATTVGAAASKTYNSLMGLTVTLWVAYPIVFFFAEYSHAMTTTFEILCYGLLDITAKCVFGFILLSSRDSLEQATSGYSSIASVSI